MLNVMDNGEWKTVYQHLIMFVKYLVRIKTNSQKPFCNNRFFFPDTCSDDWLTFDNSCYKIEKNLDLEQNQGLQHCSNRYNAQLAVINSREEALFLGSALDDLRVSTTTSLLSIL